MERVFKLNIDRTRPPKYLISLSEEVLEALDAHMLELQTMLGMGKFVEFFKAWLELQRDVVATMASARSRAPAVDAASARIAPRPSSNVTRRRSASTMGEGFEVGPALESIFLSSPRTSARLYLM